MKHKAIVLINMGLYMDLKVDVEIEVPTDLKDRALVEWLHTEYHGLLERKEIADRSNKVAMSKEKKEKTQETAEHDAGGSVEYGAN